MKLPPNVENRPENSRKNGYRNKNQSPFSINLSAVFSDGTSGVACVSNPAWPKGTMSSILPHGEVAVILCFVLPSGECENGTASDQQPPLVPVFDSHLFDQTIQTAR